MTQYSTSEDRRQQRTCHPRVLVHGTIYIRERIRWTQSAIGVRRVTTTRSRVTCTCDDSVLLSFSSLVGLRQRRSRPMDVAVVILKLLT